MADIKASVGNGGHNADSDVTEVQLLLNAAPVSEGGANPVLDIDGWCGKGTIAAIHAFQKRQLGWSDGRVDPGKGTIRKLNELASSPGARPVPLPDMDPATLALQSSVQATRWGAAGLEAVNNAIAALDGGGLASLDAVVQTALASHFHLAGSMAVATLRTHLAVIQGNYTNAIATIARGLQVYRSVSRRQMNIDEQGGADPAYTFVGSRICFTPLFHARTTGARPGLDWTGEGFGPLCRAAMVLHEPIHFVDPAANFDTYEHGPAYATLTAQRASHNASSYPSFGAHVFEHSPLPMGPRYGAGRPAD